MATEDFKRKLTAILSADVAGYSRLMGDDEADTVKTLESYKRVVSSLIKQHRGRVVDSPGDNLLAEFVSVVDAVQCAVAIQKELQTQNAYLPENRKMEFRIGVNLGDVIEEQDRIYGDGVNIAARLEALADPGGICVSKTAFDHIESKLPLGYEFLGEQKVKNIAKPIGAYRVLMEPRVTSVKEAEEKKAIPFWRRKSGLSIGIIVILGIAAVLYWNFNIGRTSIEPASVEKMAYPLPDKPSIGILPFTNMSGDPEQDYIGDGLSENIITALSVSSQMFVIARNATFTYKGTAVKPQQVAEDLGVQYILEGSIQKSGDQLRVTAQLIDALTGHHLWSDVYDREMKNLFELQDEITKKIMVSLQVVLSGSEEVRVYAKSTDNLEAWKHYIKGQELFNNYVEEDNAKAREHFEIALKLDPKFVASLSMLAETHIQDFIFEWGDSLPASMNLAFEFAQEAVKLDELDPYAHAILGLVYLYQRQYEKAITEEKRAIALNPNYAYGYSILAETLYYSGRFDEAITLIKKAFRLNPLYPSIYLHVMATSYLFLDRYEDALEAIRQMETIAPPGSRMESLAKVNFSRVYQELGREEKASAYMLEALKINPDLSLENFVSDPYKDSAHHQRLLDDLRKSGMPEHPPGAVREKSSIAVLPFEDFSPEKDQGYFVDGLSEEILNTITQIPDLTVIARTSSFSFKGKDKTIKEIANELGVDHILGGSMRKAGDAIRITAQLIKAGDGSHLWSKNYDLELKDVFKVQDDIATAVADELKITLGVGLSLKSLGGTDNIKAYELYLNALGILRGGDILSVGKSSLLQVDKAVDQDPEFAIAWRLKAYIHSLLSLFGPSNRSIEELNIALGAAQKSIEIEPDLADGYIELGLVYQLSGEWLKAELNYRKGIELRDLSLLGDDQMLMPFYLNVGNIKATLDLLDKMRRNDPINNNFLAWYYFTYGLLGDRQRAEEEYKSRNKLMSKGNSDWHDRAITITRLGSGEVLTSSDIVTSNTVSGTLKEYLGSPKEGLMRLRQIYDNKDNLSATEITEIYIWAAYFGDHEFALDALERGTKISMDTLSCWFPVFHRVRQLPRFKALIEEIGLVDYWKKYGWPDTGICRPAGDEDFVCD